MPPAINIQLLRHPLIARLRWSGHIKVLSKYFQRKIVNTFFPINFYICFGAQKNRLIETVLLSSQHIYYGWDIRKSHFRYALLTKVLTPGSLYSRHTGVFKAYSLPPYTTDGSRWEYRSIGTILCQARWETLENQWRLLNPNPTRFFFFKKISYENEIDIN